MAGKGKGAPVASPEGRACRPPRGGAEALTLLGEGLVFVSEVMAAGGGSVCAARQFPSTDDRCPSPCPGKGCRLVTREGRTREGLFSVPGAGGDWRWRWGLPLPLPQGGEGVARQKIAVFPAAPCRRVGSGERLARPRGERRCGTGSHPQGEGVPRRSAEGLFGSCWGRNGEQAPSCSRLPPRGGNSWSLGRREVRRPCPQGSTVRRL